MTKGPSARGEDVRIVAGPGFFSRRAPELAGGLFISYHDLDDSWPFLRVGIPVPSDVALKEEKTMISRMMLPVLILAAAACAVPPAAGQGRWARRRAGQEERGGREKAKAELAEMKRLFSEMMEEGYNVAGVDDLLIRAKEAGRAGDRREAGRLYKKALQELRELRKSPPTLVPEHLSLKIQAAARDVPAFLWSVKAGDINGDGRAEIVAGGLDNTVYAFSWPDMKVLWKHPVSGLPYDLVLGDVKGDGRLEIACAVLGPRGTLVLLDGSGKKLWDFVTDDVLLSVGAGRGRVLAGGAKLYCFDAAGKQVFAQAVGGGSTIGSIRTGDINGDGSPEIVVADQDQGMFVLSADGGLLWSATGHTGGMKIASFAGIINGAKPQETGGDGGAGAGAKSLFINKTRGVVKGYDCKGRALWMYTCKVNDLIYNRPIKVRVAAADVIGGAGDEIVCCGGLRFRNPKHSTLNILDGGGREVFQKEVPFAALGMAAADLDGKGKKELIFTAEQEKKLYVLAFNPDGPDTLASLPADKTVDRNLDGIYETVSTLPNRPDEPVRYHAVYEVKLGTRGAVRDVIRLGRFLREQSLGALRLEVGVREIQEKDMNIRASKARVTQWSTEQILGAAKKFAEEKIYFYWGAASHGEMIYIRPETIDRMARAAGEYFLGCFSYETCFAMRSNASRARYLGFLERAVAVCAKHGKKYLIAEPFDTWLLLPANKTFYERILKPYPGTVVPIYKANEGRCPELAVGGIVGLYRAGAVKAWGVSSQDDMFRLGCYTDLMCQCPDDVKLRFDLACASLGATYFRIEWQTETDHYATKDPQAFNPSVDGPYRLNPNARHHRELLFSLMRKGVLRPPASPRDLVSLSPVLIRTAPVPDDLDYNAKKPSYSSRRGFIARWQYPLQTPWPDYCSAELYGLERYGLGFFPRNPYGTVAAVPDFYLMPKDQGLGDAASVETDGTDVEMDGSRRSPQDAAAAVRGLFAKQAARLPFRAQGAFLGAVKRGKDEYLLVLIDPEPFCPEPVRCRLDVRLSSGKATLTDALTGKPVEMKDGRAIVDIPAGAFRLIRAKGE